MTDDASVPARADPPAVSWARPARAVLVTIGLALLLWATAALGAAAALPAGCLVAGVGLSLLSGFDMLLEERLFWGAILGAMASSAAAFGLALAWGLSAAVVWGGLGIALAVAAAGFWSQRRVLAADVTGFGERWSADPRGAGHPWPLLAVLLVAWPFVVHLMANAWTYDNGALYAGTLGIWGDWAAHLAYAGSFAYGHNFPPEFPIDPGHRLGYPFMVDFFAAELVPLGASLPAGLTITTGFLGLAFPGVMYLAARRLIASRLASALSVFVFAMGGGLGFIYFLEDVDSRGWGILSALPREYTHIDDHNYQWLNNVLANLLPQRSTLFGFAVVLIVLAILYRVRERPGWQPFAFAGVLVGLTPAFHVHSYGTVLAMAAFWAVLNRRREWIAFFVPALVLGLPVLAFLWPPARVVTCQSQIAGLCVQIGWLAASDGHHDSVLWFWLKNLGLFTPLLVVGQLWRGLFRDAFARHIAPLWLWFLVPNVVLFHPWDWDNNKFFIFWALLGSLVVGMVLARLMRSGGAAAVLGTALAGLLVLAGGLDLLRASTLPASRVEFTNADGLQLASWARSDTPPTAIFLTASQHNHPIAALAGRRVVLGYSGWIWSYGLPDLDQRSAALQTMFQGLDGTGRDLQMYRVSYVVLGPVELSNQYHASAAYWGEHGTVVFTNRSYTVYRVVSP